MRKKKVQTVSSKQKDFKKIHEEWDVTLRKHVYGHAPEEVHFKVANGGQLKDLRDLAHAVRMMDDETFRYHVHDAKNDFSTWVKDVFREEHLAAELKKFTTRMEAELALQRHLNKKLERLSRKLFYPGGRVE